MASPLETVMPAMPVSPLRTPIYLRLLAVVLWLMALAPTVFIAVELAHDPPVALHNPADWPGALLVLSFWCLVPLIGFGLFGLGAWRRSWPLAAVGGVVAGGYLFLMCAFFVALSTMG